MKKNPEDTYAPYYAAVSYLESLGNIAGGYQKTNLKAHPHPEIFLERMQEFLDRIGNPERGFKYVHITGTAGKGSVSAAVHRSLVRAGKKSGLFTSPFVVSTIEKVQVGDRYLDPLVLAELTEYIKPQIDWLLVYGRHGAPSYFEMILAIALPYFQREKCEYVVLEVGLGGRYDATNVIKNPLVTAITNIGLDHTQILGPRRVDIAHDKAGIIKPGSIFFTSETDPKIISIFKQYCKEAKVPIQVVRSYTKDHRARNTVLASHICMYIGIPYHSEPVQADYLPARFEIVEQSPLVIIDGAHNPSKIQSTIDNLSRMKYKRLFVLFASSSDKDWKKMLKLIVPLASTMYLSRFGVSNGRQAVNPALMHKVASRNKAVQKVEVKSDPIGAFWELKSQLKRGDVLLVTGSFYLAGDIRALYCPEEIVLKQRHSKIPRSIHAKKV